jgi:hypothetical protein
MPVRPWINEGSEEAMRKLLISAALAAAFAIGPLAAGALAQATGKSAMSSSTSMSTPAQRSSSNLAFPVCDATHTNHCIELGTHAWLDRETNARYPVCAHIKNLQDKAACINTAFKDNNP